MVRLFIAPHRSSYSSSLFLLGLAFSVGLGACAPTANKTQTSKISFALQSSYHAMDAAADELFLTDNYCYVIHTSAAGVSDLQRKEFSSTFKSKCSTAPARLGKINGLYRYGETVTLEVLLGPQRRFDLIGIPKTLNDGTVQLSDCSGVYQIDVPATTDPQGFSELTQTLNNSQVQFKGLKLLATATQDLSATDNTVSLISQKNADGSFGTPFDCDSTLNAPNGVLAIADPVANQTIIGTNYVVTGTCLPGVILDAGANMGLAGLTPALPVACPSDGHFSFIASLSGTSGAKTIHFVQTLNGDTKQASTTFVYGGTGVPATMTLVSGNNQLAVAGSSLATPLIAVVKDAYNNPLPNIAVNWTATGGGDATVCATTTDAVGKAHCDAFVLGTVAGTNTITATVAGAGGISFTFTAAGIAGNAQTLSIHSGSPQTGTAGSAVANPLIVMVQDAHGNGVSGVAINWAVFDGTGTLGSSTSTTDSSGYASNTFALGNTAYTNIVRATATGIGTPVAFTLTGTPGAIDNLLLSGASNTTVAGDPYSFTITIRDASNNTITDYTGTVTFSSNDGAATFPSPYTFVVGDNGTHTFSATLKTAGSRAISVTANPSGTSVTSSAITVTPAAATHYVFATQPSNTPLGTALGSIVLQAKDAFGNLATNFNSTVSLIFGTNPTSATLAGSTSISAVNGTATFSGIVVSAVGSGYTLMATGSSLASAPSASFNITTPPIVTHFKITETSYNFGSLLANTDHADHTFTIVNDGTTAVTLYSNPAMVSGPGMTLLSTTCSPSQTLAVGGSCTATVRFAPTQAGQSNGALICYYQGGNIAEEATLIANAYANSAPDVPHFKITETSYNFGSILANSSYVDHTFTLINDGNVPVVLYSNPAMVSGPGMALLSTTCSPSQTLAVGGSCTATVRFAPTQAGISNGALTSYYQGGNVAEEATLIANAYATSVPDVPHFKISETSYNFGSLLINSGSADHTFTLSNDGNVPVVLYSNPAMVSGPGMTLLSTTCSPSQTLAVGGSCTVTIRFAPTQAGVSNGALTSYYQGGNVAEEVTLFANGYSTAASANGPVLSFDRSSFNFGNIPVNGMSSSVIVTLKNVGDTNTILNSFSISSPFQIVSNNTTCSNTTELIAGDANSYCTIEVKFSPTTIQNFAANLSIYGSNSAHSGSMKFLGASYSNTATPNGPVLSFNRTSMNFGNIPVNTTSSSVILTLKNVGDTNTTLGSFSISNPFSIVSGSGTTCSNTTQLVAGDVNSYCTIEIVFAPTTIQNFTANLSIYGSNSAHGGNTKFSGASYPNTATSNGPILSFDRTSTDFGSLSINDISGSVVLTLRNVGDANTTLSSFTISSPFNIISGPGTTCSNTTQLVAGDVNSYCTIEVNFTPTTIQNFSAYFNIYGNNSAYYGRTKFFGAGHN